jgi:hypothetical protein
MWAEIRAGEEFIGFIGPARTTAGIDGPVSHRNSLGAVVAG